LIISERSQVSWRHKEIRPSTNVCHLEVGDLFWHENGKQYKLLARDAVKAIVQRWTIFDDLWLNIKLGRKSGRSKTTN